jgi:hypothetical protein
MPAEADASLTPDQPRVVDVRRLAWNHYTWHVEIRGFVWMGVGSRRNLRAMWDDVLAELRR